MPHRVCTVLVWSMKLAARCRCPLTGPDSQTFLARSPPYQPIRYATTLNSREVVDTYRSTGSPGSTLAWPAYPAMASGAPRLLIHQCGSPGLEFSALMAGSPAGAFRGPTALACRAAVPPATPPSLTAATTAAGTAAAAAARPRNARRVHPMPSASPQPGLG